MIALERERERGPIGRPTRSSIRSTKEIQKSLYLGKRPALPAAITEKEEEEEHSNIVRGIFFFFSSLGLLPSSPKQISRRRSLSRLEEST